MCHPFGSLTYRKGSPYGLTVQPGSRLPTAATDYAWRHVASVGTGLGISLLALCRIIDTERRLSPIAPSEVAALTGKASSTVARDLHTLAERDILVRLMVPVNGSSVGYTIPS